MKLGGRFVPLPLLLNRYLMVLGSTVLFFGVHFLTLIKQQNIQIKLHMLHINLNIHGVSCYVLYLLVYIYTLDLYTEHDCLLFSVNPFINL
jgi:hypothetical protein